LRFATAPATFDDMQRLVDYSTLVLHRRMRQKKITGRRASVAAQAGWACRGKDGVASRHPPTSDPRHAGAPPVAMNRRYHLAHVIPHPRLHIFHGYKEVIDSIQWGLQALGHEVTYAVNRLSQAGSNIVFGAQMLDPALLRDLPADTVIYNLEQNAGLNPVEARDSVRWCAERFVIWDYSEYNLPFWRALNPGCDVRLVPIGYAPTLSRIGKPAQQDIEVLFYGGPGGGRLQVFADLCGRLVRTVFVHGLYGESRDSLIARSRLVLNVNQYADSNVFEIARVSYLLANRKAVVSDFSDASRIEPDIRDALPFVPRERIVDACLELLEQPQRIAEWEERGFEIMRRRDIRASLAAALQ
jgi:hypothetical protein